MSISQTWLCVALCCAVNICHSWPGGFVEGNNVPLSLPWVKLGLVGCTDDSWLDLRHFLLMKCLLAGMRGWSKALSQPQPSDTNPRATQSCLLYFSSQLLHSRFKNKLTFPDLYLGYLSPSLSIQLAVGSIPTFLGGGCSYTCWCSALWDLCRFSLSPKGWCGTGSCSPLFSCSKDWAFCLDCCPSIFTSPDFHSALESC